MNRRSSLSDPKSLTGFRDPGKLFCTPKIEMSLGGHVHATYVNGEWSVSQSVVHGNGVYI